MTVRAIEVEIVGDGSRGSVLIESNAESFGAQIEELGSAKAREFVLASITKEGITGLPGISRAIDPAYPINFKGETIEQLKDDDGELLPPTHARCQPAAYRARYEVTARQ
tara:strand:+ start:652 stop:981 length:330 start_codon:yes stop_codon:yes gene_type:complete